MEYARYSPASLTTQDMIMKAFKEKDEDPSKKGKKKKN